MKHLRAAELVHEQRAEVAAGLAVDVVEQGRAWGWKRGGVGWDGVEWDGMGLNGMG